MSEPFVPSTHKEATSKPPSQDIPIDNVIPEEVYQREKGTEEFMMENPDVSYISDDYYWNEETKPSVFKNALANLSEGLASMHRKDILNSTGSNRKNSTNKPKTFHIKSGSNSRRRLNSGRSKQSQKENLDTIGDNIGSLMQQTEPNLVENKGMSNRPSAFLQEIDLKTAPQYQTLEDDNIQKTVEDSPQNLNTSLHEDDKLVTEHSDDEAAKDYPQSENILKSVKVSAFENEVASANQLEGDYESGKLSSGNNTKKYSVVIKKSKIPVGQRSVRQLQQDDLRINKTLLQTKQMSSPLEAVSLVESNKPIKRDSIPPVLPVPQNPKNVAFIKELQNRNPQLKIDGIGQKLKQKENELSDFGFKKRPLGEPLEIRSNNTSLRTVLGQAFKDAEAPPLFSLNLKGTSIGKQKESKENIKESVDYILGLYKTGAEKNPEKMRLFEMNPSRESIKATESLKRTSYLPKAQPLKEKVLNQEEISNRTSLKQYVSTGIGFKLKKSTGNEFDDKKMALPGTINLNENAFQ